MSSWRRSIALVAFALLMTPGCVLVTGNFSLFRSTPQPLEEHVVSGEGEAKILLLDVSEVIQSGEDEGSFGMGSRESTPARIAAELQRAADDDEIVAVVLRVNSPGGTVTASDAVYQQISELKQERNLPVVAHFLDVAASGGYYVALAADEIVASPTSVTGSIGVVMYGLNLQGLLAWAGIESQTIKSGDKKDIGSPLRAMTVEERNILQSVVDDMKDRFLTLVASRRSITSPAALEQVADGRVVSARQALELGLVDSVGYLPDAVRRAEQRAGVTGARVIRYRRSHEYAETMYSRAPMPPIRMNLVDVGLERLVPRGPNFFYLWSPGIE